MVKPADKSLALAGGAVLILGLAALTAVAASIKVPLWPVPVTLQTVAVLLPAVILGRRRAVLGQLTYLAAGLAGIPWFAAGGGLAYLLSPTFGYIVGFVAAAYIAGSLAKRYPATSFLAVAGMMAAGNLVIHTFGFLWLLRYLPLDMALAAGVYPFIVGDALKIGAAASIFALARNFLRQDRI